MNPIVTALLILVFGYILPLAHVTLSSRAGAWRPPPDAGCPFGPRIGWLVIVVLLGPFGWLLFARARLGRRRRLDQAGIKP